MRTAPAHSVKDRRALWQRSHRGISLRSEIDRECRRCCSFGSVNSLFGAPYFSMVPIYARDIFQPRRNGFGADDGHCRRRGFLGALLVAYLGDFRRKGWFVLGGCDSFRLVHHGIRTFLAVAFSLLFLCSVWVSHWSFQWPSRNTLLQKLVTDQMRGRVMSMFLLSFMGTMPIGNILAGAASNQFGPQPTLAVGGFVVTVVATGVAIFNKRLRELY